jgi:amino acid transporter
MVGGGIFATTGLAVELTKGAVPIAFIVSGIVALLTSYSYLKMTLRYPSEGGTVEFLNRGFGTGIATGAANILLCFSYVVLVAIYAHALGSYASSFFPAAEREFWKHAILSGALVSLALLNAFAGRYVVSSENALNAIKMISLVIFVIWGLCTPIEWQRFEPENFVGPMAIASGAMIVFFNYEGFELIANAAREVKDPKRSLPIAYVGGVLLVIVMYILIAVVTVGHLTFTEIAADSTQVLAAVANRMMGPAGHIMIAATAVLACGSAINATLYSSGRLTYTVARSGELPKELKRKIRGIPMEGMIIFTVLALVIANFVPLNAIATMGSAGFLFIFMAVNAANFRRAVKTNSRRWISALGTLSCGAALIMLCVQVDENPATRYQFWILIGMAGLSFAIEIIYRRFTGRTIRLGGSKTIAP